MLRKKKIEEEKDWKKGILRKKNFDLGGYWEEKTLKKENIERKKIILIGKYIEKRKY